MRLYLNIIFIALIAMTGYGQGTFSDTISTDTTNNWEVAGSFVFSEHESIIYPISYLYKTGDGNAIKFVKANSNGFLQNSRTLVDVKKNGYSHLLTAHSIVKFNESRLIFPIIRVLDTINHNTDSTRLYFVKTDTNGVVLDSLLFDIPNGGKYDFKDSYVASDSTFLLLGTIKQFNNNHLDISLLKMDTSFNIIWSKRYGDVEEDIGLSLARTNDNNYLVSGLHELPNGVDANSSIYKVNESGVILWQKYYGKPNQNHDGGLLSIASNDEFYLTSRHWRDGEQYSDLLLTKFSAVGDSLWSVLYQKSGETEYPFAPPIILDDGNLILSALFYDSLTTHYDNGGTVGWIIKTTPTGEIIWEQELNLFESLNGPQFVSYNNYYDIQQTADHGFVLSGTMSRIDPNGQETFGLLTKIDSNGCIVSNCANYTGITEEQKPDENLVNFTIYPNPSQGMLNIVSNSNERFVVSIFDITGRQILTQNFEKQTMIDLSSNAKGVYIYSVFDLNNVKVGSGKLIKN